MADPVFGISIRKVDEGARPVLAADLSTIGIVGPAPLADAALFPLRHSGVLELERQTKTRKLGDIGYLADAVRGINDQLGRDAVRRAHRHRAHSGRQRSRSGDQAPANHLEDRGRQSATGTGMWAFLKSSQKLGFTPRILTAPGYTSQMANGVGYIERTAPGSGYITDHMYPVTFTGGGPEAVQATGHAFGLSNGQLGPVELELPGAWYDTPPTIAVPPAGNEAQSATVEAGGIGYGVGEQVVLEHR